MKKFSAAALVSLVCICGLFAGDAAAFVDLGFSADNSTYVFGQYGKTDRDFRAYAEIYTVDVAKNDFVKGGVFRATDDTGKTGSLLFSALKGRQSSFLSKYDVRPVSAESVLYVRGGAGAGGAGDPIVFKDFENSTEGGEVFYNVRLMPLYEGKGSSASSSFYIVMERKDGNGKLLSRQVVGNPDIKRKGVTGYAIDQIFTAPDGSGIVFLVEKTVADNAGVSIRYMVETAVLSVPDATGPDAQARQLVRKPAFGDGATNAGIIAEK